MHSHGSYYYPLAYLDIKDYPELGLYVSFWLALFVLSGAAEKMLLLLFKNNNALMQCVCFKHLKVTYIPHKDIYIDQKL